MHLFCLNVVQGYLKPFFDSLDRIDVFFLLLDFNFLLLYLITQFRSLP